ncbi:MAG: His-Xaa-Ser system radical SAM maturase HxsB [Elusimicrobia bacterium]|nr:His-Xaa-Ser system radical SAM maturase HxsB [Elusimicrobiota bacterium]
MEVINFYIEKIIKKKYFISNDSGKNLVIDELELKKIINKKIDTDGKLYKKLLNNNFIIVDKDIKNFILDFKKLSKYRFSTTSLHIIVLTLKCNHFCRYCRATGFNQDGTMTLATAKKAIDFIFDTPNHSITIEFQGGEALLNWDVLKNSIDYIKEKNKKYKKDLQVAVVTNLSIMDDEKLKFMIKNNISICTSLDGPEFIHNKNRVYYNGSSYKKVVYWLKKIKFITEKINNNRKDSLPSALMTTTKLSLKYPEKIIDEYRNLGLGGIFLRPLSPIGYAKGVWNDIGYNANDFLNFYEKAIDYILKINKKELFVERNAAIKLKKILFQEDPNYLDLRSPCGASTGQLAYNYNGDIYTCDEGRMIATSDDFSFKVGNVYSSRYFDVITSKPTKSCIISSCLDNNINCYKCAFKPYCGICPVFNYEVSGKTYSSIKTNYWCDIEKGIFKILINKLMKNENYNIFLRWFDA